MKMKNGKALGLDGIQHKLLKKGGKEMVKSKTRLCNRI